MVTERVLLWARTEVSVPPYIRSCAPGRIAAAAVPPKSIRNASEVNTVMSVNTAEDMFARYHAESARALIMFPFQRFLRNAKIA